jgi:TolB-like protein/Flp pilus assembly protein TadD
LVVFAQMRGARAKTNTAVVRSVAVLAFTDASANQDQEHVATGIADGILNALADVQGLTVAARRSSFQFTGDALDPREVGRRLNVDAVLQGSVETERNNLRVTVRLAHTHNATERFSNTYNRSSADVFAVQHEIARDIARELQLELPAQGDQAVPGTATRSSAAYELYFRGLRAANTNTAGGFQQAVQFYEQAVAADAGFALAHAGLADAYLALAEHGLRAKPEMLARARAAVGRALALDSLSAEAYTAQGQVLNESGEWQKAELAFRHAIRLSPSSADAHMWLANNLLVRGRTAEGVSEFRRASELDPLSHSLAAGLSQALSISEDWDGAFVAARRATQLAPDYPWAHATLASALASRGQFEEAITEARAAVTLSQQHPTALAGLGAVYARAGRPQRALEILNRLKQAQPQNATAAQALIYANLGQIDEAFRLLYATPSWNAAAREWLRINPIWEPMRKDPRWTGLMRELGFEDGP